MRRIHLPIHVSNRVIYGLGKSNINNEAQPGK